MHLRKHIKLAIDFQSNQGRNSYFGISIAPTEQPLHTKNIEFKTKFYPMETVKVEESSRKMNLKTILKF